MLLWLLFFFMASFAQQPDAGYRPAFHFAPAKNWTNDPNGLVYYQGYYHLYFQYNPYGNKWGHMSWGHARSKDLIKWEELPVAIPEYVNDNGDSTMVFSGTAFVDSFNTGGFKGNDNTDPLIAIYTSHVGRPNPNQSQSLAYSMDANSFTHYTKSPILDIGSTEFRDPKVFWYAAAKEWIMIVSKADRKRLQFYHSTDLKKWNFLSDFGSMGDTSLVWECPDIFKLPVSNEPGKTKWVITVSSGHPVKGFMAMQYFVGEFNGKAFIPEPYSYPLYVDYGKDYYAGITYNNLPSTDKRKIMIAWANCWRYANDIPAKGGFRGMMAIPRSLTLQNNNGQYELIQRPVAELDHYLGKKSYEQTRIELNDKTLRLVRIPGNIFEMKLEIRKSKAMAGIHILKNGNEYTSIYYDPADKSIKLDRKKSGDSLFSKYFSSIESVPVSSDPVVKLRVIVDKMLVEVFIDDGKKVITDLVFPKNDDGEIELFSRKGKTEFSNIRIHLSKGDQ
jgi:fructan beta-fructosidase